MWDALTKMNIERIDHGYMAMYDEKLMNYIVEKQIPITNCPSDIASGVFNFPEDDPYKGWNWGK